MMSRPSASLPRATADQAQLKADMDAHGYCLVADALSRDQVKTIHLRLEEQATAERSQGIRPRAAAHVDEVNQWVTMLINKGRVFRDLATNPATLALVEHVLGREFLLSVLEAHVVRPGGKAMALHCDQWWLPFPVPPHTDHPRVGSITRTTVPTAAPDPARTLIWAPAVVNVMFMITDYTEQNGATRIVPGSHLSGAQPPRAIPHPVPTVPAEARAGTAIIFEGRTWHAAGVNTSDQPRFGITTTYCGPMFRQLTNFPIGTREDVLREATPLLRKLLGFKTWSSYGGIDDNAVEFIDRAEGHVRELRP
jgi:ectoine hydroxylase-related dioxygenase (phytanoyl-CoA dioxygenase family)